MNEPRHPLPPSLLTPDAARRGRRRTIDDIPLKWRLIVLSLLGAVLTGLSGGAAVFSLRQIHGRLEETTEEVRRTAREQSEQAEELMQARALIDAVDRADLPQLARIRHEYRKLRGQGGAFDERARRQLEGDIAALFSLKRLLLETGVDLDRVRLETTTVLQREIASLAQQIAEDSELEVKPQLGAAAEGTSDDERTRIVWDTFHLAWGLRQDCTELIRLVHEALAAESVAEVSEQGSRFRDLLGEAQNHLATLPSNPVIQAMTRRFEDLEQAGSRVFVEQRWTLLFQEEFDLRTEAIAREIAALQRRSQQNQDQARRAADRNLRASTELVTWWRGLEVILVVSSLLAAVVVGGAVIRTVTRQLAHLKRGIRVIEEGDLDHRVDTGTGDEIGELSRAFDQMTGALSARDRATRESEARFRGLFEQSNDGVVFMDAEGSLRDVNHRLCEMTGFTRDELLGMTITELHPSGDEADVAAAFARLEREGRIQIETRQRRADGAVNYVEINAVAVAGRDDVRQGVIRNVTAQRIANRELQRQMEEISESTHRLEVLVSNTTEREMRMVELKREVNELRTELGRAPRYTAPTQVAEIGWAEESGSIDDREGEASCP